METFHCVQCGVKHPITHGHYANPLCHKDGYAGSTSGKITCPRCHRQTLSKDEAMNAISHLDNKTLICSECGRQEGFIGLGQTVSKHEMLLHEEFTRMLSSPMRGSVG